MVEKDVSPISNTAEFEKLTAEEAQHLLDEWEHTQPMVEYPSTPLPGEHPIQNRYCFWYMRRQTGARAEDYEKSIKNIGAFGTIEQFWGIYNHLVRPDKLPNTTDCHLFKEGIKPMWEDSANRRGGKWMVRLKKGLAAKMWEDLVLAIIGEQFDVGNEICGAVVSIRYQEDIISLWNHNADNLEATTRIRELITSTLKLPAFVGLEYKRHDASLNDNSSFRNTQIWNRTHGGGGRGRGGGGGRGVGGMAGRGYRDKGEEPPRRLSDIDSGREDGERGGSYHHKQPQSYSHGGGGRGDRGEGGYHHPHQYHERRGSGRGGGRGYDREGGGGGAGEGWKKWGGDHRESRGGGEKDGGGGWRMHDHRKGGGADKRGKGGGQAAPADDDEGGGWTKV